MRLLFTISDLRKDYDSSIVEMLSEDVLPFKEPFGLFANWMDTVLKRKDLPEPNAMCLSTCTKLIYFVMNTHI